MLRPWIDTVTAMVDKRSKKFNCCCLSGSTIIIAEQDPNGEDAREELREKEGPLSGKVWPPVDDGPKRSSMKSSVAVAAKAGEGVL